MSRFYDRERDKEIVLSPADCRWLYDEFYCCSDAKRRAYPYDGVDAGEGCGVECPFFEHEPPGVEIWGGGVTTGNETYFDKEVQK